MAQTIKSVGWRLLDGLHQLGDLLPLVDRLRLHIELDAELPGGVLEGLGEQGLLGRNVAVAPGPAHDRRHLRADEDDPHDRFAGRLRIGGEQRGGEIQQSGLRRYRRRGCTGQKTATIQRSPALRRLTTTAGMHGKFPFFCLRQVAKRPRQPRELGDLPQLRGRYSPTLTV